MAALAAASLGTGCSSALQPFPSTPATLDATVRPGEKKVAVCYNSMTASADRVLAEARKQCGTGFTPLPLVQDFYLTCPLLIPTRGTFTCKPDDAKTS
jgi:hypothetical protein